MNSLFLRILFSFSVLYLASCALSKTVLYHTPQPGPVDGELVSVSLTRRHLGMGINDYYVVDDGASPKGNSVYGSLNCGIKEAWLYYVDPDIEEENIIYHSHSLLLAKPNLPGVWYNKHSGRYERSEYENIRAFLLEGKRENILSIKTEEPEPCMLTVKERFTVGHVGKDKTLQWKRPPGVGSLAIMIRFARSNAPLWYFESKPIYFKAGKKYDIVFRQEFLHEYNPTWEVTELP